MGGIQTYLAIGAIILFALLILNVNNVVLSNQNTQVKHEAVTTAASVAQAMTDEVTAKSFDKSTIKNTILDFNTLSAPDSLGPEPGEVYPTFNDVDDYDNFTKNDTTPRVGVCNVKVKVYYVDDDNSANIANMKTRTKLISVFVYNPALDDTFRLYRYKSY